MLEFHPRKGNGTSHAIDVTDVSDVIGGWPYIGVLASYLKDHKCSLKINENKPDRPTTHIAIVKCRRLPNTAISID